jgi:hypothetical protein
VWMTRKTVTVNLSCPFGIGNRHIDTVS